MNKILLVLCLILAGPVLPARSETAGVTTVVPAGSNLQTAINAAAPGDTLILTAGATYAGNFTLPNKTGSGTITIRTATPDSNLPAGTRVSPASAPKMPRIVTPNTAAAIATAPGAHDYRFVGVEITIGPAVAQNYGLVTLGTSGTAQDTLAEVPSRISIERSYIHGSATAVVRRGVAMNGASLSVVDSYVSDCHETGTDAQALCGWNGPGPMSIVNNYLEGSGENILFGGADPTIPNLVPSDIEIRRNMFSKPLAWRNGTPHWLVKNLLELKNARRVTIDGNTFEYNWADGQNGFAILFTVRNAGGTAPWSTVEDITFTNNVVRHTGSGINILGLDTNPGRTSQRARRITMRDNLFEDISEGFGGSGMLLQVLNGAESVTFDRNTAFQKHTILMADLAPSPNLVFTNNVVPHNEYGVIGSGRGIGTATLAYYFPGYVFTGNVIVAAGTNAALYPPGNSFPSTLESVGFADLAGGDFTLAPSSPYAGVGADMAAIAAAQGPGVDAGPDAPGEDAAWTNLVNARVLDGLLSKTAGATGRDDAGASSVQALTRTGYVEFVATESTTVRSVGLSNGDTGPSASEIAFAFRLDDRGVASIQEHGIQVGKSVGYDAGDVFRIDVDCSGIVSYFKNGQVLYRSLSNASFPLVVDAALVTAGATVSNPTLAER